MSPTKKTGSRKKPTPRSKTAARKSTTKKAAAKPAAKRTTTAKRSAATKTKKSTAAKRRTAKSAVATKRSTAARGTAKVGARKAATSSAAATAPHVRRAVFIDVENTSSAASLFEVIDSLTLDRQAQSIELFAVGNWRVVGQNVGRELAALGAKLVHSAPARGVRDWSDLWIAVAAGGWIARARPGDVLEIVSNDRAFDAVGDAAAAEGVVYNRVQHRRSGATAPAATSAGTDDADDARPRRRRRRPRRKTDAAPTARPATATTTAATTAPADDHEAHGASRDQMVAIVGELAQGRSSPWVNLDVLEAALKRNGFQRPPNSPRLVTRLRRLKDFEVDSHGRVRLSAAAPE